MNIRKFFPGPELAPFIKEYILIENETDIQNKTIPDSFVVLSFMYKGSVSKVTDEQRDPIPGTALSGLRKSPRLFHYAKNTSNILVIFKSGGVAAFSKVPVHEFFESTIHSENIFKGPQLDEVIKQLFDAESDQKRIQIVESFLKSNLLVNHPDFMIYKAAELMERQRGIIRVKDFASNFNISQDPFEKRFRKVIGSSPKQFASILRLRHLIKNYPSFSSLTEATYHAGYFDQSHFIKDFRQFTGVTPKDFFKSSLYW